MNEPVGPTDAALARRWQHGDSEAVATIAERYRNALGAVAYGILGDASLAEDVIQESIIRASKRIGTLRDHDRLGGFLMAIARHTALDMARKRTREVQLTGDARHTNRHPRAESSNRELGNELKRAVDRLPRDQRELFMLKYISGMSYAEIALTQEMTEAAVGQKLWRIRQKLQKDLEDFKP